MDFKGLRPPPIVLARAKIILKIGRYYSRKIPRKGYLDPPPSKSKRWFEKNDFFGKTGKIPSKGYLDPPPRHQKGGL